MDETLFNKCLATIGPGHFFGYFLELSREERLNRLEGFRKAYSVTEASLRLFCQPSAMYEDPIPPDERNFYARPLSDAFRIGKMEIVKQTQATQGTHIFWDRMMQNGDYRTVATHEELTQYMEFIDPEFDARRTVWEQRLSAREELFSSSSTQGFEKIVFAVFQTGDVKRQVLKQFLSTCSDEALGGSKFSYVFIRSQVSFDEVETYTTKETLRQLPPSSFIGKDIYFVGRYWEKETELLFRNTSMHALHYFIVLDAETEKTHTAVIVGLCADNTFISRRASFKAFQNGVLEVLETLTIGLDDIPCDTNKVIQPGWWH